jgi:predicted MPP superfamily phosphohydrolase
MRLRTALPLSVFAAGAATLAYSVGYELRNWTLRRYDVPVLAPDAEPLRVLQITDLHMLPGHRSKQEWVRQLAALDPDLVLLTGDNLAHPEAVPSVLHALEPLLDRPGATVFGSNDYYGPKPKNPLRYFDRNHPKVLGEPLPWQDLRDVLVASGWEDLTNRRTTIKTAGVTIELGGVDDPHLARDDYAQIAGPVDPDASVHIGLTHSPEPRVLDGFAQDGYDLVVAGHTHGGQLRIPYYGALVTNCGIDRERCQGLHRWSGDTWLHVSAGMGTSPYTPFRFACPPEASLLTLVPRG